MFVYKDIVFTQLWGCQDLLYSENFRSDSTIGEADYERRMGGTCCLLQKMTCHNVLLLYVQSQFFMTEVDEDFVGSSWRFSRVVNVVVQLSAEASS